MGSRASLGIRLLETRTIVSSAWFGGAGSGLACLSPLRPLHWRIQSLLMTPAEARSCVLDMDLSPQEAYVKVAGSCVKTKCLLVLDRPVGEGLRAADRSVFRGCEARKEDL